MTIGPPPATATRPKIAIFSGPTATIANSQPLVTSNTARERFGLPPRRNPDGSPLRFDVLRPQRLAAPVRSTSSSSAPTRWSGTLPSCTRRPTARWMPRGRSTASARARPTCRSMKLC
jgi:hypothetical protein